MRARSRTNKKKGYGGLCVCALLLCCSAALLLCCGGGGAYLLRRHRLDIERVEDTRLGRLARGIRVDNAVAEDEGVLRAEAQTDPRHARALGGPTLRVLVQDSEAIRARVVALDLALAP